MARNLITWSVLPDGSGGVLLAAPEYDEVQWDPAVTEVHSAGYTFCSDDPDDVLSDGTEAYRLIPLPRTAPG